MIQQLSPLLVNKEALGSSLEKSVFPQIRSNRKAPEGRVYTFKEATAEVIYPYIKETPNSPQPPF